METASATAAAATGVDHQYRPSLRLCEVHRPAKGSCGFHLSRTQWDPYPWVSGVDTGSAAEAAGLLAGDCVLEVNGEDVLGERIGAVAARVRARPDRVSLLLWNAGSDPHVANSVCGSGPTPLSLQRLSSCLQAALQLLECPVCLEPASPRAVQCANGHLLCSGCRARTERCPVCRVALGPRGRCLLADQLQALLAAACQPAPRSAAAAAAAARRKDGAATPAATSAPQQPLVQLKSRLILPPKSSSVEDICTRNQGSAQSEGGDTAAVEESGTPLRARSLSTGQIPSGGSPPAAPATDPSAVPLVTVEATKEPETPEPLIHCPRGADCSSLHPASRLMQHLQEAHEGPLVQYFLSGASCSLTVRAPVHGAAETVSLATSSGDILFVCSAPAAAAAAAAAVAAEPSRSRLLWLWTMSDETAAEAALAGHGLLMKASDSAEPTPAPIFSLKTSWQDVIASDRCLRVEDASLIKLEVVEKPVTMPTPAATPVATNRAVTAVG